MTEHEDFRFSEGRQRRLFEVSFGALSRYIQAKGSRPDLDPPHSLACVLPRPIVEQHGYSTTMAVALKLLFGEHGQTLNVFTMELGREGILNDDYYALARRACDVPYAGAWFWRQTTVCRDTAGWDGAVDVRQAIADRASVGPLAGAESARRLTMQEEFELFKGKYGGVRVDEELETVVRMARLAAAADVSASGGAQDDQ